MQTFSGSLRIPQELRRIQLLKRACHSVWTTTSHTLHYIIVLCRASTVKYRLRSNVRVRRAKPITNERIIRDGLNPSRIPVRTAIVSIKTVAEFR